MRLGGVCNVEVVSGESARVWFSSLTIGLLIRRLGGPARSVGALCVTLAMFGAARSVPAQAADPQIAPAIESVSTRALVVTLNKSRTIHFDRPFATAVVGSSDIADALPMTDRALYIQGKKIGTTNVSLFDQNQKLVAVVDLDVAIDTQNLQSKILAATGSRGIRVSSSNGQIVLSGQATDAVAAERAVAVARTVSPNGVVNAMSVAPSQQVLLKVRFLEASRDAGRDLGVNWFASNGAGTRGVTTGQGGFIAQQQHHRPQYHSQRNPSVPDLRHLGGNDSGPVRRRARQPRQQRYQNRRFDFRAGKSGIDPATSRAHTRGAFRGYRPVPGRR